jgi:pimeloyl-ACP methyl ester carboxylesterase
MNRFPVILHSHGFSCDRTLNSYNATELASHGYIVAAVDHMDCHATVFPDERGVRLVPPHVANVNSTFLKSRTNDLAYLLVILEDIDARDTTLAGRLDLTRIGVMGHSMGGGTAAEICRLDSRVKCAALLDPFMFFGLNLNPDLNKQGLQKPFLSMNRTILDHSNLLWDASGDSQHLYMLATQDATWLRITNTGHFAFSDWAWSVETNPDSRRGAEAINACLVWFFDTYLAGTAPPFPVNPEIQDVQRK